MDPSTQDVNVDPSTTGEPDPTQATSSPDVNGAPGDRPVNNVLAEFNRKYQKQQQQLDQILAYLASGQQAPSQSAPSQAQPSQGDPTDEELWARAQQGDRRAFELYQERIADRRLSAQTKVNTRQNLTRAQLTAIYQAYPVLNDSTHPLTQTAQQAYFLLTQQGYEPGPETQLEAIKTAIVDRPDLVTQIQGQPAIARDQSRVSASRMAGDRVMGASPRQASPSPQPSSKPVSAEVAALAKRMGVKDPKKAHSNFLKRQDSGESRLGAVSGFLPNEVDL